MHCCYRYISKNDSSHFLWENFSPAEPLSSCLFAVFHSPSHNTFHLLVSWERRKHKNKDLVLERWKADKDCTLNGTLMIPMGTQGAAAV